MSGITTSPIRGARQRRAQPDRVVTFSFLPAAPDDQDLRDNGSPSTFEPFTIEQQAFVRSFLAGVASVVT